MGAELLTASELHSFGATQGAPAGRSYQAPTQLVVGDTIKLQLDPTALRLKDAAQQRDRIADRQKSLTPKAPAQMLRQGQNRYGALLDKRANPQPGRYNILKAMPKPGMAAAPAKDDKLAMLARAKPVIELPRSLLRKPANLVHGHRGFEYNKDQQPAHRGMLRDASGAVPAPQPQAPRRKPDFSQCAGFFPNLGLA